MKKPDNIKEICESLKEVYSVAKQYIEDSLLKIDIYHDMTYFYDFFSELTEKEQDTVYSNLHRIYDALKEGYEIKEDEISSKMVAIRKDPLFQLQSLTNENFESMFNYMDEFSNVLNDLSKQSIRSRKLGVLNQFLTTADNYFRNKDSVEKSECNKKCSLQNEKIQAMKKERIKLLILCTVTAIVISAVVFITILYFYSKIGITTFINFIEGNIWQIIFFPLGGTVVMWLITNWKEIINNNK